MPANWPPGNNSAANATNAASPASTAASKFGPTNNSNTAAAPSNSVANKFGPTTQTTAAPTNAAPATGAAAALNKFGPTASSTPAAAATNANNAKPSAVAASSPAASPSNNNKTTPAAPTTAAAASPPPASTAAPEPQAQQQQQQPASATSAADSDVNNAGQEQQQQQADDENGQAENGEQPQQQSQDDDHNDDQQQQQSPQEGDEQQQQQEQQEEEEHVPPPPPVDPDVNLQPALRRLLQTIEPLRPTFAAMLAGDFQVPWPRGATACPPFDPLSQPSVKKALRLRGDSAMALHSLCITANHTVVLMGANGLIQQTITVPEMRRIQLVRASRKDPCVLIIDLVDPAIFGSNPSNPAAGRSTGFYVLLTGHTSGDRAEMSVKNSLAGVPMDVLAAPPPVRMPDLQPLLKRMRARVEEHDKLIAERTALLDRIRKLQFQSIARNAVSKMSVEIEDAPEQEKTRQGMLNLLVHYVCSAEARARGEFS